LGRRAIANLDGQVKFLETSDLGRNGTERRGDAAPLEVGVDAEPAQVRYAQGEIQLAALLELLLLQVVEHTVNQSPRLGGRQRRHALDVHQLAVNPENGRPPDRDMQVRCVAFNRQFQQVGDLHNNLSPNER